VTGAPCGATGLRDHLAAGWRRALLQGLVAFAPVLALAGAVAAVRAAGAASVGAALRQAALVPALVHRVPVESGPVTIRVAFLLATAGAGWLLFRAGRRVVDEAGGPLLFRAASGARVALSYAAASFIVSLPADPSLIGSLVWPLLLGVACGAVGGISAADPAGAGERRARAIAAGAWRATWLSAGLGALGILVVLALHPALVRASVDAAYRRGPATGTLSLTSAVLLLPNAGTGVASAAMGGGIELEALGVSCTVVSYSRFPGEGDTMGPCGRLPFGLRSTPRGYLLFLALPPAATVAGGWLAARRDRAAGARAGVAAGAAAGAAFGVLFACLCLAARLTYELARPLAFVVGPVGAAVGPDPLVGLGLGLAWGLAGGAVGGWLAARGKQGNGPG
jgi:Family of unknown function (DUF6350)